MLINIYFRFFYIFLKIIFDKILNTLYIFFIFFPHKKKTKKLFLFLIK